LKINDQVFTVIGKYVFLFNNKDSFLEKIENKKMKILVTGGAGFIGSHLVDALVGQGHRIIVFDNLSSGKLSNLMDVENGIDFVSGDIRDLDLLIRSLDGCDLVYHMAAMVSVNQTVEEPVTSSQINDIGTLNVLEACRKNKVKRFIFSSSSAIYGDAPGFPKDEKMASKPQSPYAVQKMTGENYACIYNDLYGVETVCLRYFNVFGPRQDPSSPYSGVISIFMSKAAEKTSPFIYGDGNQTRDFIFVADVVLANILAAKKRKAAGMTFNIGTGHQVSVNQLWELICRINQIQLLPKYAPSRKGDIKHSVASIERGKTILNFTPRYSIEDGLIITNDWYQNSMNTIDNLNNRSD
jgi:nucleoside-diphosphate-sugar epimerase